MYKYLGVYFTPKLIRTKTKELLAMQAHKAASSIFRFQKQTNKKTEKNKTKKKKKTKTKKQQQKTNKQKKKNKDNLVSFIRLMLLNSLIQW